MEPSVAAPSPERLDRRRVLSFAGLVLARLGPRAHFTVSGVFLALLVAHHTESLFAVSLALTAHRFVTPIVYPIVGRLSDRTASRLGRRVPYMTGGLLVIAVCTALYTSAGGFWTLVVLIVVARVGYVVFRLPSIAVTPEVFGGSRWIRAAVAVTVGGIVIGVSIRATVFATWDQDDPATWDPAFLLAAGFIAFAALAVAVLTREAPAARDIPVRIPREPWAERIRSVLSVPNAGVLIGGIVLSVAASGATDRAFPVYARDVLGVGGRELAAAGLIAGPIGVAVAVPLGLFIAGRLTRRSVAVLSAVVGALTAFAHLWVTELWQSVALGIAAGPFGFAAFVALAPLYLRMVPRWGGIGERLGLYFAPLALVGAFSSYLTALVYDHLVDDLRVIWVFGTAFGIAGAIVMLGLRLPAGVDRASPKRIGAIARRVLRGSGGPRGLFRGEITVSDADAAVLVEMLQDALDPYATADDALPAPHVPHVVEAETDRR